MRPATRRRRSRACRWQTIPRTFDIYLNARTFWRNIPAQVWTYKLGGYQVLKKWLSCRERTILGRPLTPEEIQYFTDTARRIGAIVVAPVESSA